MFNAGILLDKEIGEPYGSVYYSSRKVAGQVSAEQQGISLRGERFSNLKFDNRD